MLHARDPQDPADRGGALMFSGRLRWDSSINRLTAAREKRRQLGLPTIDLTETNPTRVGLPYPLEQLEEILSRAARQPYDPHPLGLPGAREALARELSTSTDQVSPDELILCASTSEAYSYLFKLLANPGDAVITGVPTYPLLDQLTSLEAVRLTHYRLRFHGRWTVDPGEIETQLDDRTRAVVLVHPNNPTGSFLTAAEQDEAAAVCRRNDLALISDEVFSDYPLMDMKSAAGPAARRDDALSFSLGGLSKSAGLPHWKLAWIRVGGPAAVRRKALAALELIADSYLSAATPVQSALADLLPLGRAIRSQIQQRISRNLSALGAIAGGSNAVELLPVEGGWSAVLRLPRLGMERGQLGRWTAGGPPAGKLPAVQRASSPRSSKPWLISDEDLAIELLEQTGVSVQPGYLFDFPNEGYLVVSLLPLCAEFAEGVKLLTRHLEGRVI